MTIGKLTREKPQQFKKLKKMEKKRQECVFFFRSTSLTHRDTKQAISFFDFNIVVPLASH